MSEKPFEDDTKVGPGQSFTPTDRITELNDIDRSISTLLSSASEAIGVLSNTASSDGTISEVKSFGSVQKAFKEAASTYFSTLSSIEVRLRRQVYALEEAGLIEQGDEKDARRGRLTGADNTAKRGGGPLDTSWLNAHATDKVGKGMERELLSQARDFVSRTQKNLDNVDAEKNG